MMPQRRRLLAGLALTTLLPCRPGLAGSARQGRIGQRWATAQQRLAPLTLTGQQVLYAGESQLGLIDLADSSPRWAVPHSLDGGAIFRPRLQAGMVIVAGRHAIAAHHLADGTLLWQRQARQQFGVPTVDRDRIFIGDGDQLLALDRQQGKLCWQFAALPGNLISYAPLVVGETVLVGPGDGRLYALRAADGAPRWTLNRMAEWQYLRQLHADGPLLLAGSYKEMLYGIDCEHGEIRWTFNAGNFINSFHVADGAAYLWSPTGWLYAVDATSGKTLWRRQTTDYRSPGQDWGAILAELATSPSHLFALDLKNVLHVMDRQSGHEISSIGLPGKVRPFVLPLGNTDVLLATEPGEVISLTAI